MTLHTSHKDLIMSATAAAAPVELRTRSGVSLFVRPAAPDDAPLLVAFFEQVSAEDLRFRFLSAVHHVPAGQIEAMVDIDHQRSENFLAFDAQGEMVATAVLGCDAALDTAEVAIAIRRDRKGQGIGWTLLEHVAREAKSRGIKRLQSIESRDNHSAIELEREMGFVARECPDDPSLMLLEIHFGG
jgi:acetyltransferase